MGEPNAEKKEKRRDMKTEKRRKKSGKVGRQKSGDKNGDI
jgi:hypothetical protein